MGNNNKYSNIMSETNNEILDVPNINNDDQIENKSQTSPKESLNQEKIASPCEDNDDNKQLNAEINSNNSNNNAADNDIKDDKNENINESDINLAEKQSNNYKTTEKKQNFKKFQIGEELFKLDDFALIRLSNHKYEGIGQIKGLKPYQTDTGNSAKI